MWRQANRGEAMRLEDLLDAMDKTAANLSKMADIWERVEKMLPDGHSWNVNPPEFDDLNRAGTTSQPPCRPSGDGRSVQHCPTPTTWVCPLST